MGNITWTNTFSDGDSVNLGTKIQQNFDDALTVLNGDVDNDNINNSATLEIQSITAPTSIDVPLIENKTNQDFDFRLATGVGVKKLVITDSGDNSLFEVNNSGDITIPLNKTNLYPIGTIIFYTGSWTDNVTFPGWYKCDGNNGTPNLVNKFIRGSGTSGSTGGYTNAIMVGHGHTHDIGNNNASHTHTISATTGTSSLTSHRHSFTFGHDLTKTTNTTMLHLDDTGGTLYYRDSTVILDDSHTHTFSTTTSTESATHTHTVTIDTAGESGTDKNIPAYYTLIPVTRIS